MKILKDVLMKIKAVWVDEKLCWEKLIKSQIVFTWDRSMKRRWFEKVKRMKKITQIFISHDIHYSVPADMCFYDFFEASSSISLKIEQEIWIWFTSLQNLSIIQNADIIFMVTHCSIRFSRNSVSLIEYNLNSYYTQIVCYLNWALIHSLANNNYFCITHLLCKIILREMS